LTAPRPIKPTSPRCHSAWQPNPGRGSTYRRGKSVQTTGTTSVTIGEAGRWAVNKLVHNERQKHFAQWLNNLSIAFSLVAS
jgi:hypothetical protein